MDIEKEVKKHLIEKYKKNENINEFEIYDFLYNFGDAKNALLYSILFMPEVVLIKNSVLLKENASNKVLKKIYEQNLNTQERETLESSVNFIEIGYLFAPSKRSSSDEEDMLLAYLVRNSWDGWLRLKYPSRTFIVKVVSPTDTGSTVGVSFYEQRG